MELKQVAAWFYNASLVSLANSDQQRSNGNTGSFRKTLYFFFASTIRGSTSGLGVRRGFRHAMADSVERHRPANRCAVRGWK